MKEYLLAAIAWFLILALFFGFYQGTLDASKWDNAAKAIHGILTVFGWIGLIVDYFNKRY